MIKLIAEIGCNHCGIFSIAKDMIKMISSFCKSDIVKFQKRCNKELLTPEQYNAPHPNPDNSYGETYGEHREFLEFNIEQHAELKTYCEENGLDYSCSVWDLTSAKEIINLKPKMIKIPSASNLNFPMLDYITENFIGEIHLSLGMTTKQERQEIIDFIKIKNRLKDLILYSCISDYPVKVQDLCLLDIAEINQLYKSEIKDIGFSGHHIGIAADIGALLLGAKYIERHFTFDKTWKGTDHAVSLEPYEMRQLKLDLENVEKALNYKPDILDIEIKQREKLKRIIK